MESVLVRLPHSAAPGDFDRQRPFPKAVGWGSPHHPPVEAPKNTVYASPPREYADRSPSTPTPINSARSHQSSHTSTTPPAADARFPDRSLQYFSPMSKPPSPLLAHPAHTTRAEPSLASTAQAL